MNISFFSSHRPSELHVNLWTEYSSGFVVQHVENQSRKVNMLTPTCLASSELRWQNSRFNWQMFPEWLNWWCDLGLSLCWTHLVLRIKILGVLGGDLRSTQGSSSARTWRIFNGKWLIIKTENLFSTTWNQFFHRPFCYFMGGKDSKMLSINTKSAKKMNVTKISCSRKVCHDRLLYIKKIKTKSALLDLIITSPPVCVWWELF